MSDTPQRLDLCFRVHWEGPWHSGSGEGSAGVDRLVRRRVLSGHKLPFLPGSQLKGVLRHQCERIAALLGCPVVSPHGVGDGERGELLDNFGPLARSGLLIDRLFGSRYQGDCLFVDDALPASPDNCPARYHGRTSIDRLSGTAREQTLFTSEVIEGGGALDGRLRARHPAGVMTPRLEDGFPYEYALLLAGLLTLDSLGANRSVGLGSCRIEVPGGAVVWNGCDLALGVALQGMGEDDWQGMIGMIREEMQP